MLVLLKFGTRVAVQLLLATLRYTLEHKANQKWCG
jgi:hypothetical protein